MESDYIATLSQLQRTGNEAVLSATALWEEVTDNSPGTAATDSHFAKVAFHDCITTLIIRNIEQRTGVRIQLPMNQAHTTLDELHTAILSEMDAVTADVGTISARQLSRLHRESTTDASRETFGSFYTPSGVAATVVDSLPGADFSEDSFIDPACGAGVFLSEILSRTPISEPSTETANAWVRDITARIVGIDINPIAIRAARVLYASSIESVLETADIESVTLPLFIGDALSSSNQILPEPLVPFDYVIGNPPWLTWSQMGDATEQIADGHDMLDFIPHTGIKKRLGHANDDLGLPFAWISMHKFLRRGGVAGFVLKREVMRQPAGRLLRTLDVGGTPLNPVHIHDFSDAEPFPDVDADTAAFTLASNQEPTFPIDSTIWVPLEGANQYDSVSGLRNTHETATAQLVPVDSRDAASPWISTADSTAALGTCSYRIRQGVKDDSDDVFGLSRDHLSDIEHGLVYPFLKSRHISKYETDGYDLRLIPQRKAGESNAEFLQSQYPQTFGYLSEHRATLERRQSDWLDRGPFYSVFGVGPYTWKPYKVVWCRLGFNPDFAVISDVADPVLGRKQLIPGDHFLFISAESRMTAHYICALLNSTPYQRTLADLSSGGKSGLSKSLIKRIDIPEYVGLGDQRRLARLSQRLHQTDSDADSSTLQSRIDTIVSERLAGESGVFPKVGQQALSSFTE